MGRTSCKAGGEFKNDEQEGDEDDDNDERHRDLRFRFLFYRPETTEEGWAALTTTCCLTCREGETDLVAGASSLEGVEWLEVGKMNDPLEPHSSELLRPTVTIWCRGADVDSGVGDTGNTAGTERILLPLQDATSHKISHGRTKVRRLRASEQW
jgi:hypothetical protein